MYASSDNNFQIDRNQIAQQLQLLGYARDETVYIRAFHPSDDPRSKEDKGRKGDATTVELIAQAAEMFQSNGRGVYFVVNGGGQKDAEVKACRAIFYEHDNLPKEEQLDLWRKLGLPEPTFQVDTGGKSIHSYWVFEQPIPVDLWKKLQADLLEFADADRSLKNPSRVMRLAGCHHIWHHRAKTGKLYAKAEKLDFFIRYCNSIHYGICEYPVFNRCSCTGSNRKLQDNLYVRSSGR